MRRVVAAALLLGLGVTAMLVYSAAARERSYRRLIAQGDVALADDQTFLAIEAYSGAIALKGEAMVGYLKRGDTYRRRGELTQALRDLRRASELDPTAPRPLEGLGDVNYALGRFSRAAEHYARYLGLDSQVARVHYKLALAFYRDGRFAAAVAPVTRATELDPGFVEAHFLRGLILLDRRDPVQARAAFERVLALAPDFVPARDQLAHLHLTRREVRAALPHLERLVALEPDRPERHAALGLAYADANRTDLAILTLRRAAERFADDPTIYGALGKVWLNVARAQPRPDRVSLTKALEALDRAASAPGVPGEVLALLGDVLIELGQVERAEHAYRQAASQAPVEAATFLKLANAADRIGHLAVARDALASYVALAPESVDPTPHAQRLAELMLRLDDPRGAAVWFERASFGPNADAPRVLARLVDAHLRAGNHAGARIALERGLALAPSDPRLRALERQLKAAGGGDR